MKLYRLIAILPVVVIAGCFDGKEPPPAPPQPLPPTLIELHIEAANDVNPGAQGQGAPVLLRIYELKGLSAFNSADFFALYNKDNAVLGGDLAGKREFLLRPGEKPTLNFQAADGATYIGAYAAFRDLDSARWRVSEAISPHSNNVFDLKLTGIQITLTRLPQSPPAPPAK